MQLSSRMKFNSLLLWGFAIALAPTTSAYQALSGTVTGSGKPVRNARIVGLTSGRVAWTDSSGRFQLQASRGRSDSAPLPAPELTGGARLVLTGSGESFEWYAPSGERRALGQAPTSIDPRGFPQGIGWILSRSERGERRWVAAKIGTRLMVRELSTPPTSDDTFAGEPESLSVWWPGRAHRTVLGVSDSVASIELPRLRSVAGDFHTHTFLTDGSHSLDDVAAHAFGGTWKNLDGNGAPVSDSTIAGYGLDWFANSEHGGAYWRDRYGRSLSLLPDSVFEGVPNPGYMWRWQSLRDLSWPAVDSLRKVYRGRHLFQGLEWNVPAHEHASVGILASSPDPIARFEFFFDAHDADTIGGGWPDASEKIKVSSHAKALAGARWLREHHGDSSWIVINHPSRLYVTFAQDLRDIQDAAGPVFLGIEAIPGHQKAASRGIYSYTPYPYEPTNARTWGGVDRYLAQVGGVMDTLWSEGRDIWVFANSDFHLAAGNDHFPGQYSKNITHVTDTSDTGILAGLRSGATVAVMGDLVDSLILEIDDGARTASMGRTLATSRDSVDVLVRFHIPARSAVGDIPKVDHVDLIRGHSSAISTDSVIASVVASGLVDSASRSRDGWHEFTWRMPASRPGFFRVRGSSMSRNTPGWTDILGNPLCDDLQYPNDEAKARSNLWFYSNPVFLRRR